MFNQTEKTFDTYQNYGLYDTFIIPFFPGVLINKSKDTVNKFILYVKGYFIWKKKQEFFKMIFTIESMLKILNNGQKNSLEQQDYLIGLNLLNF